MVLCIAQEQWKGVNTWAPLNAVREYWKCFAAEDMTLVKTWRTSLVSPNERYDEILRNSCVLTLLRLYVGMMAVSKWLAIIPSISAADALPLSRKLYSGNCASILRTMTWKPSIVSLTSLLPKYIRTLKNNGTSSRSQSVCKCCVPYGHPIAKTACGQRRRSFPVSARQTDNIKGTSDTWMAGRLWQCRQSWDAPQKPVPQG